MKKIVNIKRYPVIIDTDTCDVKALPTQCRGIDEIYVVPEDSTIVWEDPFSNDNPTKIDVKKDDILITFYEKRLGKSFVVIRSNEWLGMLYNYNKRIQEEKESYAAKRCEADGCCGDTCTCNKCDIVG